MKEERTFDKHSIFRINRKGIPDEERGVTQFGRALSELNVDIICANSPQAKGRVERMNKTLQDRLVKELRLQGISTMKGGNKFLPKFMESYNAKFARQPRSPHDAHRPLLKTDDLRRSLCIREARNMSAGLVVNFQGDCYVITPSPQTVPLANRRREVMVFRWADGTVEIQHEGMSLPFTVRNDYPYVTPGAVVERKSVGALIGSIKAAQQDPQREASARAKFAVRKKPTPTTSAKPQGNWVPPLPPDPPSPSATEEKADQLLDRAAKTRYVIKWIRNHAHLYERSFAGFLAHQGIGHFKEDYLGPVDDKIARLWEAGTGHNLPPPLKGTALPPYVAEILSAKRQVARARPSRLPARRSDNRLAPALGFSEAAQLLRERESRATTRAWRRSIASGSKISCGLGNPPSVRAPRPKRRSPLGNLRPAGLRPGARVTVEIHTARLPLPGCFNHRGVLVAVEAPLAPRGGSAGLDRPCALPASFCYAGVGGLWCMGSLLRATTRTWPRSSGAKARIPPQLSAGLVDGEGGTGLGDVVNAWRSALDGEHGGVRRCVHVHAGDASRR